MGERDKKGKKAFSRTLLKKYSFVFLSSFVSRKLSFEKWLIESYRKDECNERQDFLKFCPCHQIIIFYHSIDIRSDVLSKQDVREECPSSSSLSKSTLSWGFIAFNISSSTVSLFYYLSVSKPAEICEKNSKKLLLS